jgi:hypothetical protein
MSFAVQQNNFWAAVLGLTFPSVLSALGPSGTFYLYAGTNLLGQSPYFRLVKADEPAWVMCFLLQPETAYVPSSPREMGKELIAVDEPSKNWISYMRSQCPYSSNTKQRPGYRGSSVDMCFGGRTRNCSLSTSSRELVAKCQKRLIRCHRYQRYLG